MARIAALVVALLLAHAARASESNLSVVVQLANAIRSAGCGRHDAVPVAFKPQPKLDAAAESMLTGRPLAGAIDGANYRAKAASSIQIRANDHAAFAATLERRFCNLLTDASLTEIGVARAGRETWIVLATPFAPPAAAQAKEIHRNVLALVNAARSQGARCGRQRYAPAPPLTRSATLEQAALQHARDLAKSGNLSHRGSDGSAPSDRVTRGGYAWTTVAENVASGATTADEVTKGWLESPGHCRNIMNPAFTEMGVAYAVGTSDHGDIYWAQVFAAPRPARMD